jgi:hypothetical protein
VFTQGIGWAFSFIRQPKVIAEVIGGIILGPTVMGRIPGFTNAIFPTQSISYLNLIATIGLILFLFLVGLEVDLGVMRSWDRRPDLPQFRRRDQDDFRPLSPLRRCRHLHHGLPCPLSDPHLVQASRHPRGCHSPGRGRGERRRRLDPPRPDACAGERFVGCSRGVCPALRCGMVNHPPLAYQEGVPLAREEDGKHGRPRSNPNDDGLHPVDRLCLGLRHRHYWFVIPIPSSYFTLY